MSDLINFLRQHKTHKGEDFTHTDLKHKESYDIRRHHLDTFYKLYSDSIISKEDLHITEKHKSISPILIDLDFRQESSQRIYHNTYIITFLNTLLTLINRYIDQDIIHIYVLQKLAPRKHKDIYKDGIHIVIPDIVTIPTIQYAIRNDFIKDFSYNIVLDGFINSPESIYDEAVIEHNNWFMYGSKKPDEEYPWTVTQAFQTNLKTKITTDIDFHDIPSLVKILSIRSIDKEESRYTTQGKYILKKHKGSTKDSVSSFKSLPVINTLVSSLVDLLSQERVDNYNQWIRVGWCLHNIDDNLLNLWITFSEKSCKFKNGECEKLWANMENQGLNIGSLHRWAKEDSPIGYLDLISKQKSTDHIINIDDIRNSPTLYPYEFVKPVFEKTHAKIMIPILYIEFYNDTYNLRDESSLKQAYRNIYCVKFYQNKKGDTISEKQKFINAWINDSSIRTYRTMTFLPPPLKPHDKDMNLWRGFAVDNKESDSSSNITPFIQHTKLLTGNNDKAHDYFIKWMAQLIQQPGKLTGIALIFISEEGAGKNIFWDYFAKIIGTEYYFETPNPEKDLFSRFSNGRKNKLLIDIDEANSKDTFANSELLKNMITSEHFNYEQKGLDPIKLPNFARLIFTTNNILCAKITDNTRRYVIFETSNIKIGDQKYFNELAIYFNDIANQKAIVHFLRNIDINNINWIQDRPLTDTYIALRSICADPIIKFLGFIWEKNRFAKAISMSASELLDLFHTYLRETLHIKEEHIRIWNRTMFGLKIKNLNQSGISKMINQGTKRITLYEFNIHILKQYLVKKGIITDDLYMFLD